MRERTRAPKPLGVFSSFRWGEHILELWPDAYVPEPLVAGRPWYRHCGLCGLDEGGQHYGGCVWRQLIEAHQAADWSEALDQAERESEERSAAARRRERAALRHDRG